MKRLVNEDILTASREIPLLRDPLITYINQHVKRLSVVNPKLAELLVLIAKRAEGAHEEIASYTPLEFRLYITSLILILLRSIEVAESREESVSVDDADPSLVASEFLARISRPPPKS